MRSAILLLTIALSITSAAAQQAPSSPAQPKSQGTPNAGTAHYGLGTTPTPQQIAGWNIDASQPDGQGLPPGRGSVAEGKQLYEANCVACHGADGMGPMDRLVGGQGTLDTKAPVRTVGSYWPYATTLWDYTNRAMPFTSPHMLTHDQVYAVTAYVLFMNKIVPENAVLDAKTLAAVKMPNAGDFSEHDPRPDVKNTACMSNCPSLTQKTTPNIQPNPSQNQ
jgi:cytochrome c